MSQQNNGQNSQPLIKPEQVDNLPFLTPEQKTQYKNGLTQLWQQLETLPQGSPQHQEVQQKLRTASVKMMQQLASSKNSNRPGSQGRPAQPGAGQPGAGQPNRPAQLQQNAQTGQAQQGGGGLNNLPQAARQELQTMKVNVPANFLQQGTESANAYRKKFLQHLATLHQRKEAARGRGQSFMQNAQRYSQAGQPVPAEITQAMEAARRDMTQADNEIRTLKVRNEQNGQGAQGSEMQRQPSGAGQQQSSAQQQINGAQQQSQQQVQQQQQQAQQQAQQQQEMQRQAAMQAANNAQPQQTQGDAKLNAEQQRQNQSPAQPQLGFQQQQNAAQVAPTSTLQQTGAQPSAPSKPAQQTPQSATQPQPPQNFPQQQNVPHPQQAQQRPPQINTQQLPQQAKPPQQSGPNSAIPQSAGQQQHAMQQQQQQRPQPLSHQAAVTQAAESYSRQQNQPQPPQQPQMPQVPNGLPLAGAPNSAGPSQTPPSAYPPMPSQPSNASTRFPINKTTSIDPRTQVPVQGPPSRPTLGTTGMMQQPGTQRAPIFTLEGEGDRVLSKRKLDELVRQVTGGGEDGALAPDVEEAVLTLADDFVDNVIVSACRLAKLRSSQTLDIRDIQMVLERNYGIRIPGYSLDEMRTVRKFQPAPGWQSKMQAIQAGKVMGNKDS